MNFCCHQINWPLSIRGMVLRCCLVHKLNWYPAGVFKGELCILISNSPKTKVRYKRKQKEIHFPSLKCYHDLVRTVKNKRKGKIQGAKTIFHAMAASSWYSFLEKGVTIGSKSFLLSLKILSIFFFFHNLWNKSQIWEYLFPLMSVCKHESKYECSILKVGLGLTWQKTN